MLCCSYALSNAKPLRVFAGNALVTDHGFARGGHDLLLGHVRSEFGGDAPTVHDGDTMRDAEAYADFRGRVDDGQTLLRLLGQKLEHFRLSADITAAARLIKQDDFGLGRQHFANHDLLLVAAGKRTYCRFAAISLDVHIPDRLIDYLLFALARCEKTLGHFCDAGERQVLANRHRLHETVALAIF